MPTFLGNHPDAQPLRFRSPGDLKALPHVAHFVRQPGFRRLSRSRVSAKEELLLVEYFETAHSPPVYWVIGSIFSAAKVRLPKFNSRDKLWSALRRSLSGGHLSGRQCVPQVSDSAEPRHE